MLLAFAPARRPIDFFTYQPYRYSFFLLIGALPVCILSVYIFLYILFPFLQKKRYAVFIGGTVAIVILDCIVQLCLYILLRPYRCPDCSTIMLREEISITGVIGINVVCIISGIALGIKFTKHWYLRQINNRILSKQKISSELKLVKARIQPDFLFKSLQALHHKITSDKNLAAEMLLKISELLSYMLYEYDADFVLLQRELIITNEFIELEKNIHEANLTVVTDITSSNNPKYIPSFILLSLVQNCYIALHNNLQNRPHYLETKVHVENDMLYCNINIHPVDPIADKNIYTDITNTIINRLETFYNNNYRLKFTAEKEKITIMLSLLLLNSPPTNRISQASETNIYVPV